MDAAKNEEIKVILMMILIHVGSGFVEEGPLPETVDAMYQIVADVDEPESSGKAHREAERVEFSE